MQLVEQCHSALYKKQTQTKTNARLKEHKQTAHANQQKRHGIAKRKRTQHTTTRTQQHTQTTQRDRLKN
jgi:hypothetical protein